MAFRVGPDADPDRYVLGPAVASGNEGILYRGSITTVTGLELAVAIKMLQPRLLPRVDEWHGRWSEQVELLRSLQVPGVVRVRDGFLGPLPHAPGELGEGKTLYLVMNWVEGEPLDEWVRHQPDRDPLDALKILLPVAAALDLMHSGSATGGVPVVHRDVKPANIVVAVDATVLVDFGLTRGLPTGSRLSGAAGTKGYMAPETELGVYTPAGDRYALGGVAFFILTGIEPPITHQPDVLRAALASVPSLAERSETVDHLMKMLDEDPSGRPDGLANWVGQLRRSSLGHLPDVLPPQAPRRNPPPPPKAVPIPAPAGPDFDPPEPPTTPGPTPPGPTEPDATDPDDPQPAPRHRRRRRLTLRFILVAVLGMAGVAWALWPPPPRPSTIVLPNYVNELQYEAQYKLQVLGFRSVPDPEFNDAEAGHVTAQSPPPGGPWKRGTTVTLTVSKGPELVAVPDLSGKTQEQASSVLTGAGHKVGAVSMQADERVPKGLVVSWSLKDTQPPKGTAIDLVVSSGPPVGPPPPSVLSKGTLTPGSYVTNKFRPNATFAVKDGWTVALETADHLTLQRTGDPQGRRVDVMRVQRVYDRRPFSTSDDALNSVSAFYGSLSPWLAEHPSIKAGQSVPVAKIEGANDVGQQLDATFVPYAYDGCPTQSPTCVILFQLDPFPPEKLDQTHAYVARQGEKTRFQIFDVGDTKIVVAITAQEQDFQGFAAEVTAGLFSMTKLGDDARITRTSVQVALKAGNDSIIVASVTVDGPKCNPSDGSTVSIFADKVAPETKLTEHRPIQGGKAVIEITPSSPKPHRYVVMYDGDANCDSSVSAPAIAQK
ncbi:MAG: PASTA domain-containing protein [Actinomycetota bacterium]|nr:PASTA domain-containing protein [Actinomycetota bacterium]